MHPLTLPNTPNTLSIADEVAVGTAGRPFSPMEVIADMCGDGLGLTSWWDGGGEEEEEEDAAAGEGGGGGADAEMADGGAG